jgi:hypothetical protein
MKKKLKRVLSFIDISCFDTCTGWNELRYHDDYYQYFDSEDDIERRGSLLIFAWMLQGAMNGCEYPFDETVYLHGETKPHYIDKYIEKFLKCKNEIQRDFPITFEEIRILVQNLVFFDYITKVPYFKADIKERLIKLAGFSEVFGANFKKLPNYSGCYGAIKGELDVDMMIEKLGVKVITFDTPREEVEKIMNE